MPITASQIVEDRAQKDGRRYVVERHTDHTAAVHQIRYVAQAADNVNTIMAARVSFIEAQLKAGEIQANMAKALNAETVFTFVHSTIAENRAAARDLFKVATKWELIVLGWVINQMALSDNQLKALFAVNDAQLPALKSKLADLAAKYEAAILLVGQ